MTTDRESRGVLGLSAGGLGAIFVSTWAPDTFGRLGLQSPGIPPQLVDGWKDVEPLPMRIFIETGTEGSDVYRLDSVRAFSELVRSMGHTVEYVEVPFEHDWDNWGPMIDDALRFLYPRAG